MSNSTLQSSTESVACIAAFFRGAQKPAVLSVSEDLCFGDKWLDLGEITLKPGPAVKEEEECEPLHNAVRFGFYEWTMAQYDALKTQCLANMGLKNQSDAPSTTKAQDTTRRALHSLIDLATRLGLLSPHFDPAMVAAMPFRRPTTVIADTNAVGKGGVDFLVRFLCRASAHI